ncbi:MAG: large conductance mechanosensitive channel protein MscL [archaeon]|nr:large conductance mechanosensitive channel protein MscL [archaeon]
MNILKEFRNFLKEYKVTGMAVGIIIGLAVNSLVKSLVENLIMPLVTPFLSGGWREASLILGPVIIKWGAFTAELINFIILAFVVFIIIKFMNKETKEKEVKKK